MSTLLIQYASGIGNGFFAVVIRYTGIPADLGHEQTVALHAGHGFFRISAGRRVGALPAYTTSTGTKTQSIRMYLPNFFH